MIINHHIRVEIKAHNFNSSTVNKRFLPPVISISPVTFFIFNRLRSLSADSHDVRPSRVKPSFNPELLCAFTTVESSLQRRGKKFFSTLKLYSSHPSSSSEAMRDPTIKTDQPSCRFARVPQRVLSRHCLLGSLLEKPLRTSR